MTKDTVALHVGAATRSHRLFLQLHHLLHQRAADLRRTGRDVCVSSNRTVDERDVRRTRIEIIADGAVVRRLMYRCDGGIQPWPHPDRPHLRDRTRETRYYALAASDAFKGSPHWSARADGGGRRFSNRELVNGWLARLTARERNVQ